MPQHKRNNVLLPQIFNSLHKKYYVFICNMHARLVYTFLSSKQRIKKCKKYSGPSELRRLTCSTSSNFKGSDAHNPRASLSDVNSC